MRQRLPQGLFMNLDVAALDLARFAEGRLVREYKVV